MAQKTRAQLASLIATIWQSNSSGLILPENVRPWYQDLVDSLPFFLDGEVGGVSVVVLSTTAVPEEYEANIGATSYKDGTNFVLVFPNDPPANAKVRFDGLPYQDVQVFKDGTGAPNIAGDIRGAGPLFFTYRSSQFQITFQSGGGGIEVIDLSGSAGVYTGVANLAAYVEGDAFIFSFPDNPPDNSTINLDGLGAKNVNTRTGRGVSSQNLQYDFYVNTKYQFTFTSDTFEHTKFVQNNDPQIFIQAPLGLQAAIIEGWATGIGSQFPHLNVSVDTGTGGASLVPFRITSSPFYLDSSVVNGGSGIWGFDFYTGYGPPLPDERPVFGSRNNSTDNTNLPVDAILNAEITYRNELDFPDLQDNFDFPGTPDWLIFRHNSDAKIPALTIKDLSPGASTWQFNPYEYRNVRKTHQASEIVEFTRLINANGSNTFAYKGFIIYTGITGGEKVTFRSTSGLLGSSAVYGGNGELDNEVLLINLGDTYDSITPNATGIAIVEYYFVNVADGSERGLYLNPVGSEDIEAFLQSDGIITLNPVGGLISINTTTEFKVRAHTWAFREIGRIKQIEVPEQDIVSTVIGSAPVTYIYFEESTGTIVHTGNAPSVEVPNSFGDRLPLGNIDHDGANTQLLSVNILPQCSPAEPIVEKLRSLADAGQGTNFNGSEFQEWSDGAAVDEIETTAGIGFRTGGNYINITDLNDLNAADYIQNPMGGGPGPTKVNAIFYGYSDNGVFNLVATSPVDGVSDNANSWWDGATIATVGSAKWSAQRLFYFYGSGAVVITLGLSTENDLATIKANWRNESFITPPDLKEGVFRGVLFLQGNFTNWTQTTSYEFLNF